MVFLFVCITPKVKLFGYFFLIFKTYSHGSCHWTFFKPGIRTGAEDSMRSHALWPPGGSAYLVPRLEGGKTLTQHAESLSNMSFCCPRIFQAAKTFRSVYVRVCLKEKGTEIFLTFNPLLICSSYLEPVPIFKFDINCRTLRRLIFRDW